MVFCLLGDVSTFTALCRKWVRASPFLSLKEGCPCGLIQYLDPMQMETYEEATIIKHTCKGTLPCTLKASRHTVHEHTAVLYLCNKPEEYASAHTCCAEAEKGLRTWAVKYECYLSLVLNPSHAAETNSFRQTLNLMSPGSSGLPHFTYRISPYRLYIHCCRKS